MWPRTHIYKFAPKPKRQMWANLVEAKLVTVPPHSIFVGRADLEHAGAGCYERPEMLVREAVERESTLYNHRRPVRGHMYFIRHRDKDMFGDQLHMHSTFEVSWQNPEKTRESDDDSE